MQTTSVSGLPVMETESQAAFCESVLRHMQTDKSHATAENAATTRKVILYSQPGCAPCFAARMFLKSRAVPFEYKDIQASPDALRELMELGSRSTPTLLVGTEIMIGFDPEKLDAMLQAVPALEADAEPAGH